MTFLAYHAWDTAHAIVLTLVRLVVTKRRLLEWETAAAAAARAAGLVGGRALRRFVAEMMASPIIAAVVALRRRRREPAALLVGARRSSLLWIDRAGRRLLAEPAGRPARQRPLGERERPLLRRTARKTWRYFETFVTEADALAAARQLPGGRRAASWRAARRRPTSA